MQYDALLAGTYHVEKTLDRSTYSVLCVGKHTHTGQEVRLRLWPNAHVTSPEAQQRIQAEVAAIQNIHHPHLQAILDVRATEQGVCVVSPIAQGGSLNTRLDRHFLKPLPLAEALMIVQQVGQALYALHEHGITHGNLTPLAIFFHEPDHVSLGEFHLQNIQQHIQGYQPLLDENIPRCWYMAPEQFRGDLNAQTDQYALGCLAYTLLTGRVPFAGSARATLLHKHQDEQPRPLNTFNDLVPTYVETAVLKALVKLPAGRHENVLAFLRALENVAYVPPLAPAEDVSDTPLTVHEPPVDEETADVSLPVDQKELHSQYVRIEVSPVEDDRMADDILLGVVVSPEEITDRQAFADLATLKQPTLQPTEHTIHQVTALTLLNRQAVLRTRVEQAARARGFAVLAPMIALVLVLVLVLSSWLVLLSGHTPPPHVGTTMPNATPRVQATATSNVQPTPAETVNAIGLHGATPTAGATTSPTGTPTTTPTVLPTATPTTPPTTITPVLNCITSSGTIFIAFFGYVNTGKVTVTIPVGANNLLLLNSSLDSTQNQPTSFTTGTKGRVFQVRFSRRTTVTWSLTFNGNTMLAQATTNSPMC